MSSHVPVRPPRSASGARCARGRRARSRRRGRSRSSPPGAASPRRSGRRGRAPAPRSRRAEPVTSQPASVPAARISFVPHIVSYTSRREEGEPSPATQSAAGDGSSSAEVAGGNTPSFASLYSSSSDRPRRLVLLEHVRARPATALRAQAQCPSSPEAPRARQLSIGQDEALEARRLRQRVLQRENPRRAERPSRWIRSRPSASRRAVELGDEELDRPERRFGRLRGVAAAELVVVDDAPLVGERLEQS